MVSIFVPISYLVFLFGSLAIFSRFYRRAQIKKEVVKSWFPQHKSRDIYVSLLSLEPPPPRPILVAALLRRAMDDVKLIWSIRDSKQALQTLLTKGQIGDELWERFQEAEKELEAEIVEVAQEANTFQEGYGQQIFGLASEMVNHERIKEAYQKIAENRKIEAPNVEAIKTESTLADPGSISTPPNTEFTAASPAPLSESSTTPKPPSPVVSPRKVNNTSAISTGASTPAGSSKSASKHNSDNEDDHADDDADEDDDIDVPGIPTGPTPGVEAVAPSSGANGKTPASTPGSTPSKAKANKKGAIKKKVKGGR